MAVRLTLIFDPERHGGKAMRTPPDKLDSLRSQPQPLAPSDREFLRQLFVANLNTVHLRRRLNRTNQHSSVAPKGALIVSRCSPNAYALG
jgi:hypothetical protein